MPEAVRHCILLSPIDPVEVERRMPFVVFERGERVMLPLHAMYAAQFCPRKILLVVASHGIEAFL